MVKHPTTRSERLALKRKNEEKRISEKAEHGRLRIKEFIKDQETRDELETYRKQRDLHGQP